MNIAAPSCELLAWIPFVSPMPYPGEWWWMFLVPLVVAIAWIWKAVRSTTLDRFPLAVIGMSAQVLLGMAGLGVGLLLLVRFLIPLLPV